MKEIPTISETYDDCSWNPYTRGSEYFRKSDDNENLDASQMNPMFRRCIEKNTPADSSLETAVEKGTE